MNTKASRVFALSAPPCDMRRIDISNPVDRALLAKAYDDVYMPAFPIKDERDSLDLWVRRLENDSTEASHRYAIFVAGDNLSDPDQAKILGISVGIFYTQSHSAMMAYNAVVPEARGKGIGKHLVALRKKAVYDMAAEIGVELRGIFLEVNDPALVERGQDSMDPQQREDAFKRWGAHVIPFNYIQPPLSDDQASFDRLNLMCYPNEVSNIPTLIDVMQFMTAMYKGRKDHPDYQRSMESLVDMSLSLAYATDQFGPLQPMSAIPAQKAEPAPMTPPRLKIA